MGGQGDHAHPTMPATGAMRLLAGFQFALAVLGGVGWLFIGALMSWCRSGAVPGGCRASSRLYDAVTWLLVANLGTSVALATASFARDRRGIRVAFTAVSAVLTATLLAFLATFFAVNVG